MELVQCRNAGSDSDALDLQLYYRPVAGSPAGLQFAVVSDKLETSNRDRQDLGHLRRDADSAVDIQVETSRGADAKVLFSLLYQA